MTVWALAASLVACGGGSAPPPAPTPVATYAVGGAVSGLTGNGLVLQLNGSSDLNIAGNGAYAFAAPVASGAGYTVTVKSQPTNPSQTCSVANGSGTVGHAAVSNVTVVCSTNSYTVGGTVTGLSGSGLVLQNNAGDDLAVAADGSFTFAVPVASGASYTVTVKSQPRLVALRCSVSNGSGTVTSANVSTVAVSCVTPTPSLALVSRAVTNSVEVFRIDPATGALQYLSGTSSVGQNPVFVAVDPSMKFAYVVNNTSNNIAVFQIDVAAGTLTPIAGSPFATGTGPESIAFDPRGRFAYVSHPGSSQVSIYAVNATTGVLTETAGSPFAAGSQSRGLQIAPSGTVAYAGAGPVVNIYSVDPLTGALAKTGSVASAGGAGNVAVDPGDRFVFTPYYDITWAAPDYIDVFAVTDAGTGALSQVSGSPFTTSQGGLRSVAVDPTGRFAYAASIAGGVTSHSIHPTTGQLTETGSNGLAGSPYIVVVDPSGRYVYVANDWGSIAPFAMDGAGLLTPVGAPYRLSGYGSYGPMGIAIVAQ